MRTVSALFCNKLSLSFSSYQYIWPSYFTKIWQLSMPWNRIICIMQGACVNHSALSLFFHVCFYCLLNRSRDLLHLLYVQKWTSEVPASRHQLGLASRGPDMYEVYNCTVLGRHRPQQTANTTTTSYWPFKQMQRRTKVEPLAPPCTSFPCATLEQTQSTSATTKNSESDMQYLTGMTAAIVDCT